MTNSKIPVRLYWWNEANFGDALSQIVVEHVSGRPVAWARPPHANLFAIGSIMKIVARRYARPTNNRPYIWGTGMIGPHEAGFKENVEICSLRGPLTASFLNNKTSSFGDAGLLAANAIPRLDEVSKSAVIIPHHTSFENPERLKQLQTISAKLECSLFDVRTNDAVGAVQEIAKHSFVYSESLHGLIIADSYGIPNRWINGGRIHQSPEFKFLDYFLSVGRPYEAPLGYAEIEAHLTSVEPPRELSYASYVEATKQSIFNAFPDELRA